MDLTCNNCGNTGPDVEECVDPFQADVWGETVIVQLCKTCYQLYLDEI